MLTDTSRMVSHCPRQRTESPLVAILRERQKRRAEAEGRSTVRLETKFLRLRTPVTLGSPIFRPASCARQTPTLLLATDRDR